MLFCFSLFFFRYSVFVFRYSIFVFFFCLRHSDSGRPSSSLCQKSSLTFEQVPNIKFWKRSPNITSFESQDAILFFVIRFSFLVFRYSFFVFLYSLFVFRFSKFGQADYQVLNVKNLGWYSSRCRILSSESSPNITSFECQNAILFFCYTFFVIHVSFSTFGQADYQLLNVRNLVWHLSRCRISNPESRARI